MTVALDLDANDDCDTALAVRVLMFWPIELFVLLTAGLVRAVVRAMRAIDRGDR